MYRCCQKTAASSIGLKFEMENKTAAEIYQKEATNKQHLQPFYLRKSSILMKLLYAKSIKILLF
ncbi:hypothetical protein NEOC95_000092 [Neochlamydia sp. AcF95]|nr:hypothetical protein [Neochlamydia sp. AcF95]